MLTHSSPVSLQDFYCSLQWDQSRDVAPLLEISVILQCASFCVCIFIPATIIKTTYVVIGVMWHLWLSRSGRVSFQILTILIIFPLLGWILFGLGRY